MTIVAIVIIMGGLFAELWVTRMDTGEQYREVRTMNNPPISYRRMAGSDADALYGAVDTCSECNRRYHEDAGLTTTDDHGETVCIDCHEEDSNV